jgi:hypothetical protein
MFAALHKMSLCTLDTFVVLGVRNSFPLGSLPLHCFGGPARNPAKGVYPDLALGPSDSRHLPHVV